METVSICGAEVAPTFVAGKVKLAGEKVIAGGAAVVPVSETLCAALAPSSVAEKVALAGPVMDGLKMIERVQLAPGARVERQVLLARANSVALVPAKK